MSLYNELKRRNVFRVAIAYLAGAWLLIEVTETLFPIYGISDAAIRLVVTLLAIGLPIILVLSWVYELTPEGLKLDKDIDRASPTPRASTKKLDRVIIVLLTLALGYFAFDKFVLDPQQDVKIAETAAQAGAEQALEQARLAMPNKKSIAVLAFADMSPDKDQEYFSDGLSDTLIHVLTQVSGLKVTTRNSSFYFKGQNIDISEIAHKLNVGTILEGSVQKSGNRIRVIAQLINASDGTHLWSKSFNRELQDIFTVQDEIAQDIVIALKVTLLDTEEERLTQRYQPSLEAYEQLILGRQEMAKRTAEGLDTAEQHFKQAIKLDPDFALAYVGLANTYDLQAGYTGLVQEESLKRRQPLIEKSLELDSLSSEAYAARARIHESRLELEAAEEDFLRAIELNPNNAQAHLWYSILLGGDLSDRGRFEEALVQIRLAAELDPMALIIQQQLATATWSAGRAEEALTLTRRNIMRNPTFSGNYRRMSIYQTRLGHVGEAQWWYREARKRSPEDPWLWWQECAAFLNLDDPFSAETCLNQLSEVHPEKFAVAFARHRLLMYRGKWDEAILNRESLLERLPGQRNWTWILADLHARQGDVERARHLMANVFPEYLGDELELTAADLPAALIFAAILHANGEMQRRDILLLAMEERIATLHRIRGRGYGIIDVYIHSMHGDHDRAIAGLREAIEVGWRKDWWILRQDWKLESLHQDPEFIALMNELEADILEQRQWYEKNKDKPLF